MKNRIVSALALAVLGAASVAHGATFLNITDTTASAPATPWTYGVRFTTPTPLLISDIQYFNVAAGVGNTIRVGLWNSTASSGLGNAAYYTTVPSPSGANAFTSLGNPTILIGAGTYMLGISGFLAPNSLGDSAYGNSTATYSAAASGLFTGITDFVTFNTDPTVNNPAVDGYSLPSSTPRWKSVNFTYTPVPEPETYAMVAGAALVGFGLWRRRQAK